MEPDNPGMHTTDTIDFEVVLSGEVVLELDDGAETVLRPGDTVVQNGDPAPMIDCWADSDEITLFGARATFEKGYKAITDTMRWVAGRFAGAAACRLRSPSFVTGRSPQTSMSRTGVCADEPRAASVSYRN